MLNEGITASFVGLYIRGDDGGQILYVPDGWGVVLIEPHVEIIFIIKATIIIICFKFLNETFLLRLCYFLFMYVFLVLIGSL